MTVDQFRQVGFIFKIPLVVIWRKRKLRPSFRFFYLIRISNICSAVVTSHHHVLVALREKAFVKLLLSSSSVPFKKM